MLKTNRVCFDFCLGFAKVGGYYEMKEAFLASSVNLTQVESVHKITINSTNECIPTPSNDSFLMLKVCHFHSVLIG